MRGSDKLWRYANALDPARLFLVISSSVMILAVAAASIVPPLPVRPKVTSTPAGRLPTPPVESGQPPPQDHPEPEDGHGGEISAGIAGILNSSAPASSTPATGSCLDREVPPLPERGTPGAREAWKALKEPLPPAPVWNPPGPRHVGIQAGHWASEEAPLELERIVGVGASSSGYVEMDVTLDLAQRTAAILQDYGVEVDVLPAIVPPGYTAHAFVAIHADAYYDTTARGFKVARAGFSSIPDTDDVLADNLNTQYEATTGMRRDDERITSDMRYYYAFNSRRYCHALALGVPAAIIETGYLTNASDRYVLISRPDTVALGIARGVLSFLSTLDHSE